MIEKFCSSKFWFLRVLQYIKSIKPFFIFMIDGTIWDSLLY